MDLLGNNQIEKRVIELKDAQLEFFPYFFVDSKIKFQHLRERLNWRQDHITLYGKTHPIPRLHCWYADKGKEYKYSGVKLFRNDWRLELAQIKSEIENLTGRPFNGCLCNLYRGGQDYAAWHSDDEAGLGKNPYIASASFGETRRFVMKHKYDKGVEKFEIELFNGSLLIMKGKTQSYWQHQLAKTQKKVAERVNLTFRQIM